MSMRKRVVQALPCALLTAFIFFIYGPLYMYFTNRGEFWFGLTDILGPSLFCGTVVFLLYVGVSILLPEKVRIILRALLFGISFAVFVQGSFIKTDLGVLDGNSIDWDALSGQSVWNTILWLSCISIPVICVIIFRKVTTTVLKYAAIFIVAMQMVSLCLLAFSSQTSSDRNGVYLSSEGLNDYGDENVFVFVLDNFDDATFKEIMMGDPTFLSPLDGFTYFNNNTGKYTSTKGGLPYVLTGVEYHNEKAYTQYIEDAWTDMDAYRVLKSQGYDLCLYTDAMFVGTEALNTIISNADNAGLAVSSHSGLMRTMYKCTAFRFFPHIMKPFVWLYTGEFDQWKTSAGGMQIFDDDNLHYYAQMKDNLQYVGGRVYRFIHLWGTHAPFTLKEDMSIAEDGSATAYSTSQAVLKIVYEYLEQLKENGVYDNSTILITADHGYTYLGRPTNPIFLFKPRNSTGEIAVSDAPVSHDDLIPTIMQDLGLNEHQKYGKSAFDYAVGDDRIRRMYFYSWSSGDGAKDCLPPLIEYQIDPINNEFSSFHMVASEDAFAAYELGTKISFAAGKNARTYCYNGFSGPEDESTWAMGGPDAVMGFKLSSVPESGLVVTMNLQAVFNGMQQIEVSANEMPVFNKKLYEAGEYSFLIPQEALTNSALKLTFTFPDAVSPFEVSASEDRRPLSVLFKEMVIDAATELNIGSSSKETEKRVDIGNTLTFYDACTALPYCVEGFSSPEMEQTWMTGKTSTMEIPLADTLNGDFVVKIEYAAVLQGPQRLLIKAGEKTLWNQRIEKTGVISFVVPASQIKDQCLTLTLEHPDAVTPKSLGINDDERILSIALRFISLLET